MTKIDQIAMGDGRTRPRIVIITASSAIADHLDKTIEEAEQLAQEAFNKLHTDDHYPTHEEILKECGIVLNAREHKPWPPEEDCPGCDKHKDGPHRFGCSVHGVRQMKISVTKLP